MTLERAEKKPTRQTKDLKNRNKQSIKEQEINRGMRQQTTRQQTNWVKKQMRVAPL